MRNFCDFDVVYPLMIYIYIDITKVQTNKPYTYIILKLFVHLKDETSMWKMFKFEGKYK